MKVTTFKLSSNYVIYIIKFYTYLQEDQAIQCTCTVQYRCSSSCSLIIKFLFFFLDNPI